MAAGFGVFGMILKRLEYPTSPVTLGFVLGGLMEGKLRTAMACVHRPLGFINRPIAFILLAMNMLALAAHIWTMRKARQGETIDEIRTDTTT